jgi:hypothetical protein
MRIKITTNETNGKYATGSDVSVIDADTGEEIPGVYRAEWSCDVGGVAEAVLYIKGVHVDVEGIALKDVTQFGDDSVKKELL